MNATKKKLQIITGINGYVGSQLKKYLEKNFFKVVGIDKKKIKDITYSNFDLRNNKKTYKFFEKKFFSTIYHFGTHSALAYKDNFEKSFEEDCLSLFNLISVLKKDVRLVYLSSSYVYSGFYKRGVNEKSFLKPEHNFGFAKKFFEEYILKFHPNSVIFRLSSIFGPGKASHPNAIYNLVKECKEKKSITIWGKGERKMQYVYIGNILKYISIADKMKPGIYNLAGNEYLKLSFVGRKISKFFKSKLVFNKDKKEAETLCYMDNSKIKNAAGDFFTSFEKSLNVYLKSLN